MAAATKTSEEHERAQAPERISLWPLRCHRLTILLLYGFATLVTFKVMAVPEAHVSLTALLSSAAILATLGSAISALGSMWERDLSERVFLNVDIFYQGITRSEPWRRWPFLPRKFNKKLLSGDTHGGALSNPKIPIDVGTHRIYVDLPTVHADFFDLPVLRNLWPLARFRSAVHTCFATRPDIKIETVGLTPYRNWQACECLLDIWSSVAQFRIARYALHLGSALTIAAVVIVAVDLVAARL